MSTVRTRFAPSPTGYMHIGGMRTALFSWLWARHNNGQFILRIDDTDRERNLDEALAPILSAFRWLNLDWDEGPEVGGPFGPYYQSQRGEIYRQSAQQLLEQGKVYRCFETTEQIQADRDEAQRENRPYINARRSLELSEADIARFVGEGRPFVVRFLVPRDRKIVVDDVIRGRVEWDCSLMADPVIQRSDGSVLYNFATVVDDAQMEISHVIRAEEHLSNTPVQVLLHEALGHALPTFAHVPYVAAPGSKEKLSKRKLDKYRGNPQFRRLFESGDRVFSMIGMDDPKAVDPTMMQYYEQIGYLPEAVFNSLVRLGWSLDDKTEILSRDTVVEHFTLERVVKSPAGFDPDKLDSLQQHWMNELALPAKVDGCLPYLLKAGLIQNDSDPDLRDRVGRLISALGERLKLFSDVLEYPEFFLADDKFDYDEKAFDKRVRTAEATDLLRKFAKRIAEVEPFDAPTLEQELRAFVEAEGTKIGSIIHALRIAVTGKPVGPGLFDCLALLGRAHCLARIERTLSLV